MFNAFFVSTYCTVNTSAFHIMKYHDDDDDDDNENVFFVVMEIYRVFQKKVVPS